MQKQNKHLQKPCNKLCHSAILMSLEETFLSKLLCMCPRFSETQKSTKGVIYKTKTNKTQTTQASTKSLSAKLSDTIYF